MTLDKVLGITSAIFSICGTYVIWKDAQEINKKNADLLLDLARKVGTWVDHPLGQEKLEELAKREEKSGHLNIRGFLLLSFCYS
jgi:hypothetical protein